MDYRQVIESKYNREKWQELLHDIFRKEVTFWTQPQSVTLPNDDTAKNALYLGKINLSDGNIIAIYEVELSDRVVIERNRANIRNLLCANWQGMGCAGAFMFCFRQNEASLRFSYVSESFAFAEDGFWKKTSTDTKRFTYLLGEGHRSRTAIAQFKTLQKSNHTLMDVTKAFSVEALSDMFFNDYKAHYENIIEFITGKRMVKVANKWEEKVTGTPCSEIMQEFRQFPDAEKAVRDYVKKLMGRLVFLQFLQKKGWMGCSAGEAWNDGDKEFLQNLFTHSTHKDTFVDDVLEPLFNDINTKREGDLASNANVGKNIKIPYLNGGLFEKDEFDYTAFPLPSKFMKDMLDFFASYNFTIDENDPDDAEIGVDPEMLGRIFENLLEDNKDKGAFYTPKEIVQYMCRESLIAYLQTNITDEAQKNSIRNFVLTHEEAILSDDLKIKVDQKLKDVKICDPAIGSGAFPMGLLRELYACRKAIEGIDDNIAVSIKTHIIQNNIYGVDIEKGAVDIARLRFWLALIVDEKNPHALPNMDFKIMQGNSLLEQYEGIDLSGMSANEVAEQKAKKKGQAWQQTFAFDEQDALENIQNAIKAYYLTDDHDKKIYLREVVNNNVRSYILNLKGFTPDIKQKLENLPIPNDKFFLWHIYFKEVFDKGGFDIVIGNPPYGADIDNLIKIYGELYPETSHGYKDIYKYFFDCFLNKLKADGVLCYITPNTFLRQPRYKDLRKVLLNYKIGQILDLGENIFEEAVVTVAVSLIYCNNKKDKVAFADLTKVITKENASKILSSFNFNLIEQEKWKLTPSNIFIENIIEASSATATLDDILKFKDAGINYQRVNVGLAQKGKSDLSSRLLYEGDRESPSHVEFWKGTDINEYYIAPHTGRYCRPNIKLADNERVILNKDYFKIAPKLIWRQTAPYPIATIDYVGLWFGRSIQAGIIKQEFREKVSYEYLCGLLNSKYLRYLYEQNVKEEGRVFPQVKLEKLKPLPIIIPNKDKKQIVESLVVQIIEATKRNDIISAQTFKDKLDSQVFELYSIDPHSITM